MAIIRQIKQWPRRLLRLSKRKENPLTEADFCNIHKFEKSYFNRMKNLAIIPGQDKVDEVEAAFKKEGV